MAIAEIEACSGGGGAKVQTGRGTSPSGRTPVRWSVSFDFVPDVFIYIATTESKTVNIYMNPNTQNVGSVRTSAWYVTTSTYGAGYPTNQATLNGTTITVDAEASTVYDWIAVKYT